MTVRNTKSKVDDLFTLSDIVRLFMVVKRSTLIDDRRETDGEHTLHLQFLAVAYAAKYKPDLDIGKVALYCMVHDLVEVYAGDTPTLMASKNEMSTKEALESAALERLKKELGDTWEFIVQLLVEYESLNDDESRYVRTFDKCDPGFSHYNNKGKSLASLGVNTLDKFRKANDSTRKRMAAYASKHGDVMDVREELQKRIATKVYPDV